MKFIRYWEEGSEVMLHCALRMQQFILFHLANLVILYVFFFLSQQQIMRDRWMNVGYEEDELKPYIEPLPDYKDPRRTGT